MTLTNHACHQDDKFCSPAGLQTLNAKAAFLDTGLLACKKLAEGKGACNLPQGTVSRSKLVFGLQLGDLQDDNTGLVCSNKIFTQLMTSLTCRRLRLLFL